MYHRITAIVILFMLSMSAQATVILKIDDGTTVVTVTDGDVPLVMGDPFDSNPLEGVVTFSGSVGSFLVSVSTGISTPILGDAFHPDLHLNSVDVSSGVGSLTISLSVTDFLGPIGEGSFALSLGGVTDGSVGVSLYLDNNNVAFGQATLLATLGGAGGSFSSDAGGAAIFGVGESPFSLTIVAVITHTVDDLNSWGMAGSSFDAVVAVPEPGSLALLGIGLLGFGLVRRKRTA